MASVGMNPKSSITAGLTDTERTSRAVKLGPLGILKSIGPGSTSNWKRDFLMERTLNT